MKIFLFDPSWIELFTYFRKKKRGFGPSKPKQSCLRSNNKCLFLFIRVCSIITDMRETYQMWRARSLTHVKKTHNTFKDLHTRPVELRNKGRGAKGAFPRFSSRKQRGRLICSAHNIRAAKEGVVRSAASQLFEAIQIMESQNGLR